MKNNDTPSIERLKTCPFCGGPPEIKAPVYEVVDGKGWFISCSRREEHDDATAYVYGATEEDAALLWNTRATLETLAGEGVERITLPLSVVQPFLDAIRFDPDKKRGDRHWATFGTLLKTDDHLRLHEAVEAALASSPAEQRQWSPHLDYSGEPMKPEEFRDPPEQPDIEGRYCNRCGENLPPEQTLCPFCDSPSVPISEARSIRRKTKPLCPICQGDGVVESAEGGVQRCDCQDAPEQPAEWVTSDGTRPVLTCERCGRRTPMLIHGLGFDCCAQPDIEGRAREIRREALEEAADIAAGEWVDASVSCDGERPADYIEGYYDGYHACAEHITAAIRNRAAMACPPSRPSFDKWDYAREVLNRAGRVPSAPGSSSLRSPEPVPVSVCGDDPSRCEHCGIGYGLHEASCVAVEEAEREQEREVTAIREEIEFGLAMSGDEMLTIRRDLLERMLPYFTEAQE